MNNVSYLIDKALDNQDLNEPEIAALFEIELFSPEYGLLITASRRKSRLACAGRAEVHAQIGINLAPCPRNCTFCAFAAKNKLFTETLTLTPGQVIAAARRFEDDGANAVYFMATARFSLEIFCQIASEVRSALRPETLMIANVGDFDPAGARMLKQAGFFGIYHAVRLGEGRDNDIDPQIRLQTFEHARDAGLVLGTCVEPVGPEHTVTELVEKTLITRSARPAYSGAARRILLPDTEMTPLGTVSEARMALILAVVRLALPLEIPGNCTHEPTIHGAAAGANLLWAESGSNPRDTESETQNRRGMTVTQCRDILREAEWDVLDGPSAFYTRTAVAAL